MVAIDVSDSSCSLDNHVANINYVNDIETKN